MLRWFLVFSFVGLFTGIKAQTISPQATVSLLTIGPSNSELYSVFGHSALQIQDPASGLDIVYNYGTFDFNTPNFYLKFVRGQLPYQLSKADGYSFFNHYLSENRSIKKQILQLTPQQKEKLYNLLETNYLPENRSYLYKFFYDNCSTRLRDVIHEATDKKIKWENTVAADSTYRQWIDRYASHMQWSDFGMDIALGTPADEPTKAWGAMYIPDNLMRAADKAQLDSAGTLRPLVAATLEPTAGLLQPQVFQKSSFPPILLGAILLAISVFLSIVKNRFAKIVKVFDAVLFSVVGLAGWIFLGLWFLTDHGVTAYNWNLLWAFPLLLPFYFTKYKKLIVMMAALGCFIFLIGKIFFIPFVHPVTQAIALALLFRYIAQLRKPIS